MDVTVVGILVQYACLLFSLCAHEAAHGAMAHRCGDPTARLLGRVTLNPLAHIDPIGTVLMPLIMFSTGSRFLIGWAKPVPVNPLHLRNMRRDQVLVALAGPAANLGVALLSALLLRALSLLPAGSAAYASMLGPLVLVFLLLMAVNAGLFVFNLLPIPPLDGSHVLHYFLPRRGQEILESVGPYGILLVVLVGARVVREPFNLLFDFLTHLTGLDLR